MVYKVSPRFTSDKLVNATLEDKLAVFEDQVDGWLFSQAQRLLVAGDPASEHSGLAVVMIACSYFEMIAAFLNGESTENASKAGFKVGFLHVFPDANNLNALRCPGSPEIDLGRLLGWFYKQIRCGLFHEGITGSQVIIAATGASLSFQRNETTGELASIIIDPAKFLERVSSSFSSTMSLLRDPAQTVMREKFVAFWDSRDARPGPIPLTDNDMATLNNVAQTLNGPTS